MWSPWFLQWTNKCRGECLKQRKPLNDGNNWPSIYTEKKSIYLAWCYLPYKLWSLAGILIINDRSSMITLRGTDIVGLELSSVAIWQHDHSLIYIRSWLGKAIGKIVTTVHVVNGSVCELGLLVLHGKSSWWENLLTFLHPSEKC